MNDQRPLRILYAYPVFPSEAYGDVDAQVRQYLDRLRQAGFAVTGMCITIDPPAQALTWPELERRWRWGDRRLLGLYDRIACELESHDVLLNACGINLHPDFIAGLSATTVFQCFDDPENSHNLSRPVAAAYDLCLVGNAAEVDTYRSWGVRSAEWTPMGLAPEIYDHTLTELDILEGTRDIDLLMMGDRTSPWRTARLDRLAAAFPDGHFHGKGWPRGFLPGSQQLSALRRTKIGPNMHNSTGPVNYRTFYLPANGVLQVCDNREHLGRIFELGREVVGFSTVEECIDLCRYYLAHDRERREMAAAGWRRAMRDYTEIPVFSSKIEAIRRVRSAPPRQPRAGVIALQRSRTAYRSRLYPLVALAVKARRLLSRIWRRSLRIVGRG